MKYFCNPLNISYRYQFNRDLRTETVQVAREAADPSMICFQDRYYIFASMTLAVWVSEDLVQWEPHRLPDTLPLYDYAPDARVVGEYVYFCASRRGEICDFYRTKDILNGPYEKLPGTFDFWDPNLFCDEDGRLYFYWGCSNAAPVWGVELEPETMKPLGERRALIFGDAFSKGFERMGEDNTEFPRTEEEVEAGFREFIKRKGLKEEQLPQDMLPLIRGMFTRKPFVEGPWMDKYQGKYYLQYACPGTEYNTYGDGVYVSDNPLGPFTLAENNPYSYHPGGFMTGAGHGSTMWDKAGNLWHTATMRISRNHQFERRIGLWPAGFDADGELFCDQRYGDWPVAVEEGKQKRWQNPRWYLLSYGKEAAASSFMEGREPEFAVDENATTWWRSSTQEPGQWLRLDLGAVCDVRAVQINFADEAIDIPAPGRIRENSTQPRYIEEAELATRYRLEGSEDGGSWFLLEDKSQAETDLSHDFLVWEEGKRVRYLKLTIMELPYQQKPCVSGFRVFGIREGERPALPEFTAMRSENGLDFTVSARAEGATGYVILWGHRADKLYHSCMVFRDRSHGFRETEKRVGALVAGQDYYVRVDAFNESGITEGMTRRLEYKTHGSLFE